MSAQPSTARLLDLAATRPLTIADLPEDDLGRTELIDGSLYVSPLADLEHQFLVSDLANVLATVVPAGLRPVAGVNVIVGEHTIVYPDVAVVDPAKQVRGGLGVSPDGVALAVEITSPSTRLRDLTLKRAQYDDWGVPLLIVDRKSEDFTYKTFGDWPSWARIIIPSS